MHIFDAHLDLALNGVDWNRDLRLSVDEIRAQETRLAMADEAGRTTNTVSFPELKKAEVKTCLATLLAREEPQINHSFGWISEHTCYAMAHAHLAYYRAMQRAGELNLLKTKQDLAAHRTRIDSDSDSSLGFILTMEGADPLLTIDAIEEFYEHGLRAIGLTHYGDNRYGGGTNSRLGLHADAKPLLQKIENLGMTLDLTHLSDAAFPQALDWFGGRVHASHQNSRRLASWQRQFSDEQYKEVLQRDGVIGIAFDIIMLQEGYVRRQSPLEATIATAADNIDIVCQLAGNANQVGIGSDLDGGYGADQTPADLDRISDLQVLPNLLSDRGYSDEEIRGIMHENWFRFFESVLPDAPI
ncbi:MAG: membrane dipeptidase [Planctomycetota bacterium]